MLGTREVSLMNILGRRGRDSIPCVAGEWTRIIFDFGKGYPQTMHVTVSTVDGTDVQGQYRETHYN